MVSDQATIVLKGRIKGYHPKKLDIKDFTMQQC